MDSPKQMNDYWHIPRASLASSSAASSSASLSNRSNKAHSNPPTVVKRTPPPRTPNANNFASNYGKQHEGGGEYRTQVGGSRSAVATGRIRDVRNTRRDSEISRTSAAVTAAAAAAVLAAAKRGSRSSQGSSDSNNSTRSAASGSLLLTAANLERFAEIHKKQEKHHKLHLDDMLPSVHNTKTAPAAPRTAYNANLIHATMSTATGAGHNNNGDDVIIAMDPNLDFIKTKDLDTVSIASSMHFTMVNGEGGPPKKPKRGLCDRGRQVTVLIISMSTIFLLLIMGMVYALEMRAREMPQS